MDSDEYFNMGFVYKELEGVIRTAITYSEDIETELCRIFLPLVIFLLDIRSGLHPSFLI